MTKPRTKIVATIGKHNSTEFIQQLIDAGASTFRLNTAHQEIEESEAIIDRIRSVSEKVAVLIDTKGPEVRTVGIAEPIPVGKGDRLAIVPCGADTSIPHFSVSYADFCTTVPVGTELLIDDGDLSMTVEEKDGDTLHCVVNNDGTLVDRKSVNVPEVPIALPPLTEKDEDFIRFAARKGVDFIAHSFVRNKDDVLAVQALLDEGECDVKIIAKIENKEGIHNLDEILDHCYGVMIARGDLGIELPAEEVPVVQKRMIRTCVKRRKVVITATQMLHSMIENPRPTRAEVSDVANAVLDGTDALMLSGETAYGEYAVEAVQTMAAIARKSEEEWGVSASGNQPISMHPVRYELIKSAVEIASKLETRALIVHTDKGRSARLLAAYRSRIPVMALSPNPSVVRQLTLSYGVEPYVLPYQDTLDDLVSESVEILFAADVLESADLVVMLGSSPKHAYVTNFLEVGPASQFRDGRE